MSKNKFFKKLLIGGLCALTATAMIGATACKPEGGEEETGHVHNYATTWSKDENGHWYACLNDGHTGEYNKIPHADTDNDGECDACGWDMSEEEEDPTPATPATQKIVIDVKDVSDSVADGAELKAETGVYAAGALASQTKSGSSLYNNATVSFTKAIKTGGIAKQEEGKVTNAVKFDIENDNSTIVVYASSGTSNQYRSAVLKDSKFANVKRYSVGNGNGVASLVFEVKEAGTYYFGGADKGDEDEGSGGIYIYYMAVWDGGKLPETTVDSKQETPATCETPGNITYTKTSFGRYLNSKGEPIAEGKTTSPALGHDYSLVDESFEKPTETEVGSVVVECATDAKHNFTAEVPVLGSDKYESITPKADLPEGSPVEDGEAWYTYVIPDIVDAEGKKVTVEFAAEYVAPATYLDTVLYSNFLNGTVNIGKDNATSFVDGIKIYGRTNLGTEITEWSESTYSVTASNDKLTVIDKGYDASTKVGKAAFAYILFDQAYTSGVYKVEGTINLSNYGNGTTTNSTTSKWSPLQLIAEGLETDADTFASMRADNNKKLGVAQGTGGDDVVGSGYAYAVGTDYGFEFIVDLDAKEVTLSIYTISGETKTEVYKETVTITAEKWGGLRLQTADNADRTIVLSNLVISQRTVVDNSAEN